MRKYLLVTGILLCIFCSFSKAEAQIIIATGTPSALSTTYGAASTSTSFSVSGTGVNAAITVTAPGGFLVSSDNITFSAAVFVGAAGAVAPTTVYIEISGKATVGNLSGNILLSSSGAATVKVAMAACTVSPAVLTITANNANKTYGTAITGAAGSTAFTTAGLQNGETVGSVTILYSSGSAATDPIGNYIGCAIAYGATGGTFKPANYTISYSAGEIIVKPAALTIKVDNITKTYGETITGGPGSTAFTATGLQNGETISSVTILYTTGSAATDPIGTYIGCAAITAIAPGNFTASNYVINYTPGNIIVTPAPLTISAIQVTKTYGTVITGGPGSTVFSAMGLQNAETISSVTVFYSSGSAATDQIGTYIGCVIVSAPTGVNFNAGNYVITYVPANIIVVPATLTITANNVTKPYGTTLAGGPGSTAFTATGLQNGETAGTVTITYGAGAAATDAAGTYTGAVVPSLLSGGNFTATNYVITYIAGDLTVLTAPSITATGVLTALTTTYGTPSATTSFMVSGVSLTQQITVTAPPGFEISTDNINFSSTITTGVAESTTIYVRLAATTQPGNYSGYIVLSSAGAPDVNENIPLCEVTPATLTITANDQTRPYGENNPVFTVTYSGFVNGDGPAQLTALPVVSTTASVSSPAGQYPINARDAASPDYTFVYVPGVLTITPAQQITIPNAFTPNGDGINDTWNIQALNTIPNCTVTIFNRQGQNVYNSTGYGTPWDGTYHGSRLPAGTYYYFIDVKHGDKPLAGYVTLVR